MNAFRIEIVGGAGPAETAALSEALRRILDDELARSDPAIPSAWVRTLHAAWRRPPLTTPAPPRHDGPPGPRRCA